MSPRLAIIFVLSVASSALAADQEPLEVLPPPAAMRHVLPVLSSSCGSASCHGQQGSTPFPGSLARNEYTRWHEFDPHAKAARTLHTAAFQRILAIVSSGREDGPADKLVYARCAACHDPEGLASTNAHDTSTGAHGISCQSCHGQADLWLTKHYERGVTKAELTSLGMIDTKNLLVRAKACAGCHIGDGDRDMNHDMIAAGHPPLRFELSAYHDFITRKHWPEAERLALPEFKVKLWAAGQVAAAENTVALLASRATRAASDDKLTPWPEFAEYDCFACHQRLRPGLPPATIALRPVAKNGIPGWQAWNLTLAQPLLDSDSIGSLRTEMERSFGNLAGVKTLLPNYSALLVPPDVTGSQLLTLVGQQSRLPTQSWSGAGQQLLALQAAYFARLDAQPGKKPAWAAPFEQRVNALRASLIFCSRDFEWPAFDWQGLPDPQPKVKFQSLAEISEEIAALAGDLQAEYNALPQEPTLELSQP